MTAAPIRLRRAARVVGHRLVFEPVSVEDSAFILSLRLDPEKSRYLNPTADDLVAQQRWIAALSEDDSQAYFLIRRLVDREPVGTIRLYDLRGDSFCWGSWILSAAAPPSSAVESTVMVYSYALRCGFERSHFDVRKGNEKVWQYHERWGARRVAETDLDYHYELDGAAIRSGIENYGSRLPDGVSIVWADREQ